MKKYALSKSNKFVVGLNVMLVASFFTLLMGNCTYAGQAGSKDQSANSARNCLENKMQRGFVNTNFENGDKYLGYMEDGKFNGVGIFTWADGSHYVGEFRNGRIFGEGVKISSEGIYLQVGYFVNNQVVNGFKIVEDIKKDKDKLRGRDSKQQVVIEEDRKEKKITSKPLEDGQYFVVKDGITTDTLATKKDFIKMVVGMTENYIHKKLALQAALPQEEQDQNSCQICFETARTHAALPCGHYKYCEKCLDNLMNKGCAICRKVISGKVKIYE